jgi:hypothetical protein
LLGVGSLLLNRPLDGDRHPEGNRLLPLYNMPSPLLPPIEAGDWPRGEPPLRALNHRKELITDAVAVEGE